jgi:hypothetical protein
MYFAAFLSVCYHFNFKKKSFTPPVVYTGYKSPQTQVALQGKESDDANLEEDESTIPQTKSSAAVTTAPEIGPAPLKQTMTPQQNQNLTNLQENEYRQPERQTVDINLRIMLEDGKMVVDTISSQPLNNQPRDSRQLRESRTQGDTMGLNRPNQRIRSLQQINNPADIELETDSAEPV